MDTVVVAGHRMPIAVEEGVDVSLATMAFISVLVLAVSEGLRAAHRLDR
jgi:hypothetical protein